MQKYHKGKNTIAATEKAYELIYKAQGYKPLKPTEVTDAPEAQKEA